MFGKRRTPGLSDGPQGASHGASQGQAGPQGGEGARKTTLGGTAGRGRSLHDGRRPLDPPSRATRQTEAPPEATLQNAAEGRTLVVGQGIRLSGEIKRCETLVVEGEVEANLTDCLSLEINDSGLFKGSAVVEQAEISGRLEGELTVNGRLFVRATGHLHGTIRYADLEIERGGRIAGSVDVIEPPAVEEPTEEPAAETSAVAEASEPAPDRSDESEATDPAEKAAAGNSKTAPKEVKKADETTADSGALI